MVTETNEYKGRQFKCDSCGYVVSSNAMSDFDVDDFSYCPYCGFDTNEKLNKTQVYLRVLASKVMEHQNNYSEDNYHMFSKGVQAFCVAIENEMRKLNESE